MSSDEFRDQGLLNEGIRIEDSNNGLSLWKLYYPKDLLVVGEDEEDLEAVEKLLTKKENQLKDRKKQFDIWTKCMTAVVSVEKTDEEVEAMGKKAKKKYKKLITKAQKDQKKYDTELAKNANFMEDLKNEISQLEAEIAPLQAKLS